MTPRPPTTGASALPPFYLRLAWWPWVLLAIGAGGLLGAQGGVFLQFYFLPDVAEPLECAVAIPSFFGGTLWVLWMKQRSPQTPLLHLLTMGPMLCFLAAACGVTHLTWVPDEPARTILSGFLEQSSSMLGWCLLCALLGLPLGRAVQQPTPALLLRERSMRSASYTLFALSSLMLGLSLWRLPTSGANLIIPGYDDRIWNHLLLGRHPEAFAWRWPDAFPSRLLFGLAALGAACGAAAALVLQVRERLRKKLLAEVQEGRRHDLRIDTTEQGRRLVRVASIEESYRRPVDDDLVLLTLHQQEAPRSLVRWTRA